MADVIDNTSFDCQDIWLMQKVDRASAIGALQTNFLFTKHQIETEIINVGSQNTLEFAKYAVNVNFDFVIFEGCTVRSKPIEKAELSWHTFM